MKPQDHIERYKQMRRTLDDLLKKPLLDRDSASIVTIAHWASYHLVSAIIDQLSVVEQLKHRNHRGVKKSLKQPQIKSILGVQADQILNLYNLLEMNFLTKFQYGSIESVPDYLTLVNILKQLEVICKKVIEEGQRGGGENE